MPMSGVSVDTTSIRNYVKEGKLSTSFVRQCPGYAGFVPRSPPNVKLEKKCENRMMVSTMKSAYKNLPEEMYQAQPHYRKGPMSRTVSLTSPYNPYNKMRKDPAATTAE